MFGINMNEPLDFTAIFPENRHLDFFLCFFFSLYTHSFIFHAHPEQLCLHFSCRLNLTLILCNLTFSLPLCKLSLLNTVTNSVIVAFNASSFSPMFSCDKFHPLIFHFHTFQLLSAHLFYAFCSLPGHTTQPT